MPETSFSVRVQVETQKAREELERLISSIEGFHLQKKSQDLLPCDLLIVEIGDNLREGFQLVHNIQSAGMAREVFLTSPRFEPDLLVHALRAGAKEFFPQPIKEEEVKNALAKFKERKESLKIGVEKKGGKIINVLGSKGGVGVTTVAVNLATNLAQSETSPLVALIDMNLLFGDIPIFLDIEFSFSWGEVARNISRLDSTLLMSTFAKHSSGVYVLPSPAGLDSADFASFQIIRKILITAQNLFDFIVVDSGQSVDATSLKVLEISDVVILVTVLSLPCLTNVKRLLQIFQGLGSSVSENTRIIINRYQKKSEISLKEAEKTIDKEIFWLVPNDYSTTMSAINRGKTISSVAPGTEISSNFVELAARFLKPGEKTRKKAGLVEKLFRTRK